VDHTDLLRAARALEAAGLDLEADRLRWRAACAESGGVSSLAPAESGELDRESDPLCLLEAAIRDAEAMGDERAVARLLGALAGLERPSRCAA